MTLLWRINQLGWLILGTVQLFACWAGAQVWFDIGPILAFIIGIFLAYIPFVGTALGIYGSITAWGWPLYGAILLFVGPIIVACVLGQIFNS